VLGGKGQCLCNKDPYLPSVTQSEFHHVASSLPLQVTQAILVSLALQVILASLVSKETRDFQAHTDPRASQARGGTQVTPSRALRESREHQDKPE